MQELVTWHSDTLEDFHPTPYQVEASFLVVSPVPSFLPQKLNGQVDEDEKDTKV